jgi:sugar phosphate isomerase/epimerase
MMVGWPTSVKNLVLPHGASSKDKAFLAIHPRSSERGILAFKRETYKKEMFLSMKGTRREEILGKIYVNIPFSMLSQSYLSRFISIRMNPEIGIDAAALDQYPGKEYHRVARELLREGLNVNLHAPFMDLSPGSPDRSILALTRERFDRMGELAATFEAKGVIFHAGYDRRRYGFMKDGWVEKAVETYIALARSFRETGSSLLLENVYEHSPEDLLDLFKALENEEVGFCLDTGHQAAFSGASLDRWVQVLGPYLRQLHLHDNRGEEDEHLGLGQGSIDFRSLFGILNATIRIPPVLTLEPHKENDLWPSIEYLEKNWPWEA